MKNWKLFHLFPSSCSTTYKTVGTPLICVPIEFRPFLLFPATVLEGFTLPLHALKNSLILYKSLSILEKDLDPEEIDDVLVEFNNNPLSSIPANHMFRAYNESLDALMHSIPYDETATKRAILKVR